MEENREVLAEATQEELNELLQIRRDKLTALREAGMDPFNQVRFDRTSNSREILNNFEALENQDVSIAGRIMSKRDMGKASFSHIQDQQGKIQIYVKIDEVGEEAMAAFKKYDIGDIVGIKGFVFRTRMGEISVHATSIKLLSKSLLPLPEKYHGLRDTDTRYRQRYLDLIMETVGYWDREAYLPERIQVDYLRECLPGEELLLQYGKADDRPLIVVCLSKVYCIFPAGFI